MSAIIQNLLNYYLSLDNEYGVHEKNQIKNNIKKNWLDLDELILKQGNKHPF